MDYIEKTGKTVDEAVAEALKELNITAEEADITVIDQGKPGVFLGLGAKPAKVRVAVRNQAAEAAAVAAAVVATETASADNSQQPADDEAPKYVADEAAIAKARDFLQQVFAAMKLEAVIEKFVDPKDNSVTLRMHGDDMGILIGKHGQTLDSLQYLTNLVANKVTENRVRIVIDVEDYRERRIETLTHLARRLADKVCHEGHSIALEAMNPHERKVIHMALQSNNKITTFSEGEEPNRHIVIDLKK